MRFKLSACIVNKIRIINLAHHIGLFDVVFDLSSLFNRYPYQQRPYFGGSGVYQGGFGGGYYPGGYNQGGFGGYPGGSGLGTNILGIAQYATIFFMKVRFFRCLKSKSSYFSLLLK